MMSGDKGDKGYICKHGEPQRYQGDEADNEENGDKVDEGDNGNNGKQRKGDRKFVTCPLGALQ